MMYELICRLYSNFISIPPNVLFVFQDLGLDPTLDLAAVSP